MHCLFNLPDSLSHWASLNILCEFLTTIFLFFYPAQTDDVLIFVMCRPLFFFFLTATVKTNKDSNMSSVIM